MQRLLAVAISASSFAIAGCDQSASNSATMSQSAIVPARPVSLNSGLSEAPDAYFVLHQTLLDVDSPDWGNAARELRQTGDLFTLHVIEGLKRNNLSADKAHELDKLSAAIGELHDQTSLDEHEALRLLEVAAYADVTCQFVENPLRDWTLKHVARFSAEEPINAELKRIRSAYKSSFQDKDLVRAMESRVREYSNQLLSNRRKLD